MRLIGHATFIDLISATSLKSRTYGRSLQAFEAVDQLEEVKGMGDRVLMLARSGQLPHGVAETLLHELMACFAEPLEHKGRLDEVKRIVRRYGE